MNNKNSKFEVLKNPILLNSILLCFNIVLFCFKTVYSLSTGSLALLADTFDNFTDVIMALIGLIGLLISKRKPTKNFPYGFYKIENIVSLILSIFIFLTAYNISLQSIQTIFLLVSSQTTPFLNVSGDTYIFLIISLASSFGLSLTLKRISKQTNSPIIKSEAKEKLYDNFISTSVLIGFIFANFDLYIVDPIVSLFIVIFLIKGGYDLFLSAVKTLLDAVIDFEDRTKLYEIVKKTPKVKDLSNIVVQSYGRYIFIGIELLLSKDLTMSTVNKVKSYLNLKIKQTFPEIFKVRISTISQEGFYERVAVPILENKGIESEISSHFGEAKYFAIIDVAEAHPINMKIVENPYIEEPKRKGILIADWLTSCNIDKLVLKKKLNRGPELIFSNSLVEIMHINNNLVKEIPQLSPPHIQK